MHIAVQMVTKKRRYNLALNVRRTQWNYGKYEFRNLKDSTFVRGDNEFDKWCREYRGCFSLIGQCKGEGQF